MFKKEHRNVIGVCLLVFFIIANLSTKANLPGSIVYESNYHWHAYHNTDKKYLIDTSFINAHTFDSEGLCTCMKNLSEDDLNDAPRLLLNAKAKEFVKDYLKSNSEMLKKVDQKGKVYFQAIEKIFKINNVPEELKYLAVIESELNPGAISGVGAAGIWQLMPGTAKWLGLKVSGKTDERKNTYKSTKAAAKYIKYLYNIYGDWLLVIAAYNSGPGIVNNAIKKSGSRSFWAIQYNLPRETRMHVKKYIGTHYYYEGHGGLTTLTKAETETHLNAVGEFIAKSTNDNSLEDSTEIVTELPVDIKTTENKPEKMPVETTDIKIMAIMNNQKIIKTFPEK